MQVRYVKIGDFRQIIRCTVTRKRRPLQALSTYFGRKSITQSVQLCLQHVRRDAARRAGLSATADPV